MNLITFGCSFTDYAWPTWADIMADDHPGWHYENWGLGGGGNQATARRILYKTMSGPLTDQDLVIVQWTSWGREDRFAHSRWISEGSVALSPYYGPEFVERYWSPENDAINTLQARYTAQQALGRNLAYEMAMSEMDDARPTIYTSAQCQWAKSQLKPCDEFAPAWPAFEGLTKDGHPDPLQWMTWVETKIYPRLGLKLGDRTRNRVLELQDFLMTLARKNLKHRIIQDQATEWCVRNGWRFNKCKPGSDLKTQPILY